MQQLQRFEFDLTAIGGKVNAQDGIIEGVSVITSGVEAVGHRLEVDDTTLQQMHDLAIEMGQVPVKWNHRTGADAVNGYFNNFRIEDDKLKADWHLLKSHPQYNHALELADRMPRNVGFSASFYGISELEDGTKVFPPDEKTKHHYTLGQGGRRVPVPSNAKMFARCSKLSSVDLVASPAANPDGMFEAKPVDSAAQDMAKPSTSGDAPEHNEDPTAVLLKEFREFRSGIEGRLTALEELVDGDEVDPDVDPAQSPNPTAPERAPEPREFGSVGEVLQYFEERFARAESDREAKEFEEAVQTLQHDFDTLKGVNEQLLEENRILAEAYTELSTATKSEVEFSAGTGGEPKAVVKGKGGKELTEFEKRVKELEAEGKSNVEALTFAVSEDSERYQQHLQAMGAFNTL